MQGDRIKEIERGTRADRRGGSSVTSQAFEETWFFKANDPAHSTAFWLQLSLLVSANGFRRVAEVRVLHFERSETTREVTKTALKQVFDVSRFSETPDGGIQIADCLLSSRHCRGKTQSKGRTFAWDFALADLTGGKAVGFSPIPALLSRSGFTRTSAESWGGHLSVTGSLQIDGREVPWKMGFGTAGHQADPCRTGASSPTIWGHCDVFIDDLGHPADFAFEGFSGQVLVGNLIRSPRFTTLFFYYQQKRYQFDSLWDAMRVRSTSTLNEWRFQADRGELSFKGLIRAQNRDFVSFSCEDTRGSLVYSAVTALADMQVMVYRRGKLDEQLLSDGAAALEMSSSAKNPYLPTLL